MIGALAYSLMSLGLLLAAWTGISSYRRRPANGWQLGCTLVLQALLLVQTAVALVLVINGAVLAEPVTFLAYLGGILLPLPLGIYLARIERTRWGSASLCFTAVVISVMMLRLLQLWRTGSVSA